ncbi:aminotransferase class I/II-fold pyridoxal phosphate-dependent enzyme [Limibaculum sp. M0105]|uniref:Aminotransferase class I/II-fold pyridoxal phosphate-dependent enzyme n=1 Tax=Thermohalobaculum xanthum TaxID=2753746 RepID=A0A8J7M474_9RHOB|nr:aminotransferase class I/II-fold pyridoxal phosphate-dependent enzyme [Thermohalobaculum xanthum]MBK0397904.1 aminotransferase class I/II-fold pyridoxal phosphate-dependent enzyme [Thermohalobaculum xanthum]
MTRLAQRDWVPTDVKGLVQEIAAAAGHLAAGDVAAEIERLAGWNRQIHERDCVNLNPATNMMNPRAEALMASGLGPRPSLGYPGAKYEMGLEAIERIEVIAAELAAEVFRAPFAEVRVASGALSNLYAFMACAEPGDAVIVPPAEIGGHVTHHEAGAAGLYGLEIHRAPVNADGYTVDVEGLRALAHKVRPRLITIGGSLNIAPHPVGMVREIADEVDARLMFDAAHLCGMIAGGAWPDPIDEGAHLMTMSTYKSLGGPAGGLIVTTEAELAERLDAIAFPGLTANFDAGRVAALAVTLADWKAQGAAYAAAMRETAAALAAELAAEGVALFAPGGVATRSHQFALKAAPLGGGQAAARHLRRANILTCGIGLPVAPVEGDLNGLRLGVPEIVRAGMGPGDMPELARLIVRGLGDDPEAVAADVSGFRQRFSGVHFVAA